MQLVWDYMDNLMRDAEARIPTVQAMIEDFEEPETVNSNDTFPVLDEDFDNGYS